MIDSTVGYTPKDGVYLYSTYNGTATTELTWMHMIYLGNTHHYEEGTAPIDLRNGTTDKTKVFKEKQYWGNPFHYKTTNKQVRLFISSVNPTTITQQMLNEKI